MHNGMVQLDEEKMSKSVGNIFQLSEAIERFGRETVIAYLISGHYRQPLAFSEEQLSRRRRGWSGSATTSREHPPERAGGFLR